MRFRLFLFVLTAITLCTLSFFLSCAYGEIVDRVVASVNDTAITLSELREKHAAMRKSVAAVTENESLQSMINAQLLLEKARHMRIEGETPDELIATYIDLKIRSSVVVQQDAILSYYGENLEKLGGAEFSLVREDIEKYLTELETTKLLKEHIQNLREVADIAILL
ncbi:MAG TPA: hypothetical protein VLH56_00675 [Dissulfurispiraceae bacterium]|nr:hypothetical protein [Dissulfurispiraceae bacterium]